MQERSLEGWWYSAVGLHAKGFVNPISANGKCGFGLLRPFSGLLKRFRGAG